MSGLVLGLGGCIDYEIEWSSSIIEQAAHQYQITYGELGSDVLVTDERSLICTLLSFMRRGVGGELPLASSDIAIQFASRFTYQATVGGTGVRAAIAIAKLGIPSVVHLTSVNDTLRSLLPQEISFICSTNEDTLFPHLIVQYPVGATVELEGGVVIAPQPNRIIYVNDPANHELLLSDELPAALVGARVFLVSGFNAMLDPQLLQDRITVLRNSMEQLPPDALVFYEDAGFHHAEMQKIVSREFRGMVDVHSLNEDELQAYLGRHLDLLDAAEISEALTQFQEMAIAPVVVVHTKYWVLAFGRDARRYEVALAGGVDLASTRFCYGDHFTATEVGHIQHYQMNPQGLALTTQLEEHFGESICCVPARVLPCSAPTTIGLGDTFVGGFLASWTLGEPLAQLET